MVNRLLIAVTFYHSSILHDFKVHDGEAIHIELIGKNRGNLAKGSASVLVVVAIVSFNIVVAGMLSGWPPTMLGEQLTYLFMG